MADRTEQARRFTALWQRHSNAADPVRAQQIWEQLRELYEEPHRHYHNLDHIVHCLRHLDAVRDRLGAEADVVELAIWFHDVVYSVSRTEQTFNEARSAAYFNSLARNEMDAGLVARIEELILATTHKDPTDDVACQYLVDIDLSSFGLPWPEFTANSSAIQKEQGASPLEELVFLDMLDRRQRIFQTEFFRAKMETRARDNIARYRDACLLKSAGQSSPSDVP